MVGINEDLIMKLPVRVPDDSSDHLVSDGRNEESPTTDTTSRSTGVRPTDGTTNVGDFVRTADLNNNQPRNLQCNDDDPVEVENTEKRNIMLNPSKAGPPQVKQATVATNEELPKHRYENQTLRALLQNSGEYPRPTEATSAHTTNPSTSVASMRNPFLLPRPRNKPPSVAQGSSIQKIPVLNNTRFQMPAYFCIRNTGKSRPSAKTVSNSLELQTSRCNTLTWTPTIEKKNQETMAATSTFSSAFQLAPSRFTENRNMLSFADAATAKPMGSYGSCTDRTRETTGTVSLFNKDNNLRVSQVQTVCLTNQAASTPNFFPAKTSSPVQVAENTTYSSETQAHRNKTSADTVVTRKFRFPDHPLLNKASCASFVIKEPTQHTGRKSKYDTSDACTSGLVIKKPRLVINTVDDIFQPVLCQNNNGQVRNTIEDNTNSRKLFGRIQGHKDKKEPCPSMPEGETNTGASTTEHCREKEEDRKNYCDSQRTDTREFEIYLDVNKSVCKDFSKQNDFSRRNYIISKTATDTERMIFNKLCPETEKEQEESKTGTKTKTTSAVKDMVNLLKQENAEIGTHPAGGQKRIETLSVKIKESTETEDKCDGSVNVSEENDKESEDCLSDEENENSAFKEISNLDTLTETINRVAAGRDSITFDDLVPKTIRKLVETAEKVASAKASQLGKITLQTQTEAINTPSTSNYSKDGNVFQTRYLKGIKSAAKVMNDFEEILKTDKEVICQMEAKKLSLVKDHHLLKLSDQEREYLRNKHYLDTNPSVEVKRRLESRQTKSKHPELQSLLKETGTFTANTALSSDNSTKGTDGIEDNAHQDSASSEEHSTSATKYNETRYYVSERRTKVPVVKLQRLEDKQVVNSIPVADKCMSESERQKSPKLSKQASSEKIYYVINCADVSRFQNGQKIKGVSRESSIETTTLNRDFMMINANLTQSKTSVASIGSKESSVQREISLADKVGHEVTKSQTGTPDYSTVGLSQNRCISTDTASAKLSNPCSKTPYSGSLTVRQLLEAKRGKESVQTTAKQKVINLPLTLFSRSITGQPLNINTSNLTQDPTANIKAATNVETTFSANSNIVFVTGRSNTARDASAKHIYMPMEEQCVQREQTTRMISPSNMEEMSTSGQETNRPVEISKLSEIPILKKMKPSDSSQDAFKGLERRDTFMIKLGKQTMIVKKRKETANISPSVGKKTLPAPKPKPTVAYGYKKKIKRRFKPHGSADLKKGNDLKSKLRKLLSKTDGTIRQLAETLDLVPVSLLHKLIKKTASHSGERKSLGKLDSKSCVLNPSYCNTEGNQQASSSMGEEDILSTKKAAVISSANMANILQIYRDLNENTSFTLNQVSITYTGGENGEYKRSTGKYDYPCCLYFSKDCLLEKMDIETLRQGLFLVQDFPSLRNWRLGEKRSLKTILVPLPPHLDAVPCKSLAVVVGDMYSEAQRNQYRKDTKETDIKMMLSKFLWNCDTENGDEYVDKRYNSVTDRSMSPRISSPVFYSEKFRNAFDTGEFKPSEIGSPCQDSKTHGRNKCNTDSVKGMRFSERAMALKVRQNELLESCQKLKTESLGKQAQKRKREVNSRHDMSRNIIKEVDLSDRRC